MIETVDIVQHPLHKCHGSSIYLKKWFQRFIQTENTILQVGVGTQVPEHLALYSVSQLLTTSLLLPKLFLKLKKVLVTNRVFGLRNKLLYLLNFNFFV